MSQDDLKILLVEDNEVDVEVLRRSLRRLSLDLPVVNVHDGEEALALLRPANVGEAINRPYILLVDLNMPRMGGFDLLEELEGDPLMANVPIYILSTSENPMDRQRASRYSIRGYITKPLTSSQLCEIVEDT